MRSAISTVRASGHLVAAEQAAHLVCALQMPLGILQDAQASFVDRAFLADAGNDVGKGAALRRMHRYGIGRDQRDARGFRDPGQRLDPACIVAAIKVIGGEIEIAGKSQGDARELLG